MKYNFLSHACLILILVSSLQCSLAKVSNTQVKKPGLFYVFVSGQVILIDAVEKKTVKTIRGFDKTGIPFPNRCPGNPFNGTWNDQTVGIGQNTIFMTASYHLTGADRLPGLNDALYVVDTDKQEISARVAVIDRPIHSYYIPFENSVWTHNDGVGTFTVIQASYPYEVIEDSTESSRLVSGHGKLLFSERLGSKGFKTTISRPGVFVMDVSDPLNSAENVEYLNFTEMLSSEKSETCGVTHAAGYSSLNNQAYFGCSPMIMSIPGVVAIDADTNSFIKYWNFTAAEFYTTPDQMFMLGTDGGRDRINLLYITTNDTKHFTVQLKTNSTPGHVVVYPMGDYYWAFVSLVNAPETAIIDFNGVVECIGTGNCSTDDLSEYVSYYSVGYHNPPDSPNMVRIRPIAAGHRFVCTIARYENAIDCYDTQTKLVDKYGGFEHIQKLVFVEGKLYGGVPSENVTLKYDCSTAPTQISKVSSDSSGVSKLCLSLYSFIFVAVGVFIQSLLDF